MVLSHCLCNTHYYTSSQDSVSRQPYSHFWDITWPAQLPDHIVPRLLPRYYVKRKYTKLLPKMLTYNSEFRSVIMDPFSPQDCWSVLNDVAVICSVSYSNSTDYHEFLAGWNIFIILIKLFQFALKCYFISKTIGQFWLTLNFVQNFKTMWNIQDVPLATKPGISLIILPLMRILQRNLEQTYLTV